MVFGYHTGVVCGSRRHCHSNNDLDTFYAILIINGLVAASYKNCILANVSRPRRGDVGMTTYDAVLWPHGRCSGPRSRQRDRAPRRIFCKSE